MRLFGQVEPPLDPIKPHFYPIKTPVYPGQAFFKVRNSDFKVAQIINNAIQLSVETA